MYVSPKIESKKLVNSNLKVVSKIFKLKNIDFIYCSKISIIQKAKEGLRNLMEIAIQFQTKNLMEKGRFNKIVQKYKTFRIQKFKEKMRRKKYLMYLI